VILGGVFVARTLKLRSTLVAAAKLALPACDARIVHVPNATSVTVLPLTVHTAEVRDANVTGRPDDAEAPTANGGVPNNLSLIAPKAMAWPLATILIRKFCCASGGMPLLAVTTPLKLPEVVAVPLMRPELALRVRPGGSAPLLMLNVGAGAPLAVTMKLYAVPTVPLGVAPLVNAGGWPGELVT
jgi:hypothetical protein